MYGESTSKYTKLDREPTTRKNIPRVGIRQGRDGERRLLGNLDSIRILFYPGYEILLDFIAVTARHAKNEIIQRGSAEDIDMIAYQG